jgi:hypothetical protein
LKSHNVESNKKAWWNNTQKRKDYHESLKERGIASKQKILEIITESGSDGISTKDLSFRANLHRDRVNTLCKKLKAEGLIQRREKFGRYHRASKLVSDPRIGGFLFGREAIKQVLLQLRGMSGFNPNLFPDKKTLRTKDWISASSRFCNKRYCKDVLSNKQNMGITPEQMLIDRDGLTLFEFSLRIGALITYVMIRGLKHQGDENVWAWIRDSITLQALLRAFTLIEPVANRLDASTRDENHEYEMLPDYLSSLEQAYENAFPEVYRRLENIADYIPYKEEQRNEQLRRALKAREDHAGSKTSPKMNDLRSF